MKTTTHTPGPWTTGNSLMPFGITIWKEHDPERNVPRICQNVSTLANAQLIASAPDLLAACKVARETLMRLIDEGVTDTADQVSLASINRSIAKAEGNA